MENLTPKEKTVEEHCNYVCEMTKISLFYAYTCYARKRENGDSIADIIQKHTPLFFHALRLSDKDEIKKCYPDEDVDSLDYRALMDLGEKRIEWQRMMSKAQNIVTKTSSAEEFEVVMFDSVQEFIENRAKHTYSIDVGIALPPDYNAGSLKYDSPSVKRPANHCNFHIANAIAPWSIFDDPKYLPDCFIMLMDKSEREYGFDTLTTGTWLNDHPRWLALFPDEWIDNLSPRTDNVGWTFGNWGQMVTARGTFNHKAGNYLREHGVMKYKVRSSRCSFMAMRDKLK